MSSSKTIVRQTLAALKAGEDGMVDRVRALVATYEAMVDAAEPLFDLNNKNLEEAVKNHAKDLMFYDTTLQECRTVEKTVAHRMEEVEAEIFRTLTQVGHGHRVVGTREAPQYIKGDPRYVNLYQSLLEVQYVRQRLEAIVEALRSMAFSLNNIVKIRISQLEHITL